MKQVAKIFHKYFAGDTSLDIQLNRFLCEHEDYSVEHISYNHHPVAGESLFVVFKVDTTLNDIAWY